MTLILLLVTSIRLVWIGNLKWLIMPQAYLLRVLAKATTDRILLSSRQPPVVEKPFSTFGIFILPQPLIILDYINRTESFIKRKERFKLRLFLLKQVLFVFKKKILASFYKLFAFLQISCI